MLTIRDVAQSEELVHSYADVMCTYPSFLSLLLLSPPLLFSFLFLFFYLMINEDIMKGKSIWNSTSSSVTARAVAILRCIPKWKRSRKTTI